MPIHLSGDEGAHILGDIQAVARHLDQATPQLDTTCTHLRAYEATRR
jgi:hypothetical protein